MVTTNEILIDMFIRSRRACVFAAIRINTIRFRSGFLAAHYENNLLASHWLLQITLLQACFSKNLSQNGYGQIGSAFLVSMAYVPNAPRSIRVSKDHNAQSL